MRRPRLPFSGRHEAKPPAEQPAPAARAGSTGGKPQAPATADEPAGQASATRQATPSASGATPGPATPKPPPDAQADERIEGLRAWLAQLDRRLGVRTYLLAAAVVLAAAAAAVALVLVLSLKQDAATEDDVQSVREELSGVEQSASAAARRSVQSLNQRLTDLETELDQLSTSQTTTRRELKVVQDDIKELRSQVSGARGSSGGGLKSGP